MVVNERNVLSEVNSEWILHMYHSAIDEANYNVLLEYVPGGEWCTLFASNIQTTSNVAAIPAYHTHILSQSDCLLRTSGNRHTK